MASALRIFRAKLQRVLTRECRRNVNSLTVLDPQNALARTGNTSPSFKFDFTCRHFSNQKKEIEKIDLGYEPDDGEDDDSDWEDDQEIPFGQPMVPPNDSTNSNSNATKNESLEAVIAMGMNDLKNTSTLISNHKETKKNLFLKGALDEDTGPTKQQLAEANRILTVATRCLEQFDKKGKAHPLSIHGHSILIIHVDVNSNLKEATVHWALPFEILMEVNENTRQELSLQMQQRIENGGGSYLQGEVHRILSSYYPPKLKFKPASDVVLQEMMFL